MPGFTRANFYISTNYTAVGLLPMQVLAEHTCLADV